MNNEVQFREFGPVPWWAWSGKMDKTEMLRQMEVFRSRGIDEFFIYAVWGLEYPRFLEDSWFEYVHWTVQEAKKMNMKVWIYDDLNWPSGAAAGFMLKDHPEYRSRSIQCRKMDTPAGDYFFYHDGCEPLAVFVRKVGDKGAYQRIELTDNVWKNELGYDVELLYFDIRFYNYPLITASTTINTWNQRGYCDLLNADAVKSWMGYIHEKYYKLLKDECGKTLKGFFFDEPFLMHYHYVPDSQYLPWTEGFFEAFSERYGYDMVEHLPELMYEMDNAEQVRCDYWNLITEFATNGLSKTLSDWCAERNLLSTGHCVGEEITNQRFRLLFNGDIHKLLKYQQIPGMDMLSTNTPWELDRTAHWYGKAPGTERVFILTAKQACSTARYANAPRMMAEAMGVCTPDITLADEKRIYDWLSGTGVSLFNENCFGYTSAGFRIMSPGNKMATQPWMKHYHYFSDYIRFMSRFAASAPLAAEVTVLIPEETIRSGTPASFTAEIQPECIVKESMLATIDTLTRSHIEFEMMFEDILCESVIADGKITYGDAAFKVLVIPQGTILQPELTERITAFVQCGGTVIAVGARTRSHAGGKLSAAEAAVFASIPCIAPENVTTELPELIAQKIRLPYKLTGENTGDIFAALRGNRLELSNQGKLPVTFTVESSLPRPVSVMLPAAEKAYAIDDLQFTLERGASIMLTFGDQGEFGMPAELRPLNAKDVIDIDGPWDYQLTGGNSARPKVELGLAPGEAEKNDVNAVKCWIPVSRDGRHGLGFAPEESAYYWLRGEFIAEYIPDDLGMVLDDDGVEVFRINGQQVDEYTRFTLWDWSNRRYDIAKLVKPGVNRFEIRVKTAYWSSPACAACLGDAICPLALHGTFATEISGKETRLVKLPEKLQTGDVKRQGFTHYTGSFVYRTTFTAPASGDVRIHLPEFSAGSAEVRLNGKTLGVKLWKPYVFDTVGALQEGENVLEVELTGRMGGLISRSYGNLRIPYSPLGLLGRIRLLCD